MLRDQIELELKQAGQEHMIRDDMLDELERWANEPD